MGIAGGGRVLLVVPGGIERTLGRHLQLALGLGNWRAKCAESAARDWGWRAKAWRSYEGGRSRRVRRGVESGG